MLHTPCVTVRRNTERQITLEIGSNRLVSADARQIVDCVADALSSPRDWPLPERWDDRVAERVVAALERGVTPLDH
jgi:UDP-N-acetylglucosamine 2-epimerase (non-hydrolysing)